MTDTAVRVDVLLIGAGPVGLYGAYYAGFRGLRAAVMDTLPHPGGQIGALYPEKYLYDIAGLPQVKGQELVDNLVRQAAPFDPTYLLGQQAQQLEHTDEAVRVTTDTGTVVDTGAVIITAGVGAATPRALPCGEDFLGRGLSYFVGDLDLFTGRDVIIVGGGDSAVDWALAAVERAHSVHLVHRRQRFRAHEHSIDRLRSSTCAFHLDAQVDALHGNGHVEAADVLPTESGDVYRLPAQVVVAALGFKINLGPIAQWGLDLHERAISVDSAMRTSLPGVYAAGDITTYDGKVKLISVGFGEVATAVNNAAAALHPEAGLAPEHSSHAPPPPISTAPAASALEG